MVYEKCFIIYDRFKKRHNKSNLLYKKAKRYIASGTNTFSRAPGVFPDGGAPKILKTEGL